ncbi:zinc finger protein ZIC 2-like, partial [Pseudonaja textilis]|uniref:zinc finger protein ZIC 2-like n=1 Tax=Pseudonaja textilis TaxID=8673 RepID=UPI000EA93D88
GRKRRPKKAAETAPAAAVAAKAGLPREATAARSHRGGRKAGYGPPGRRERNRKRRRGRGGASGRGGDSSGGGGGGSSARACLDPGREEEAAEEDVARGGEMAAENKPEDDHGNSNGSHVKIFLPKKLLECLPKCSSLPKERHRWNTNERS